MEFWKEAEPSAEQSSPPQWQPQRVKHFVLYKVYNGTFMWHIYPFILIMLLQYINTFSNQAHNALLLQIQDSLGPYKTHRWWVIRAGIGVRDGEFHLSSLISSNLLRHCSVQITFPCHCGFAPIATASHINRPFGMLQVQFSLHPFPVDTNTDQESFEHI